jgi:hypothetical protein
MPVPQAAFAHMFPPGHVLPHLKVLQLTGDSCVGPAQIAMIAASCPALQELKLSGATGLQKTLTAAAWHSCPLVSHRWGA